MRRKPTRRLVRRWTQWLADAFRHPWTYLTHRLRSRVIAGPGLLGFSGGVFNPGAVRTADGNVVLLAKAQRRHWRDAGPHSYMRGAPLVVSLDRNLRCIRAAVVSRMNGLPPAADTEIEDFRLFRYAGEVWSNHSCIEVMRTEGKLGYRGSRVCLSRFDIDDESLSILGHPRIDFEPQRREKNWVFVESGAELYLLYSFDPFIALRLDDRSRLAFSTVIDRPLNLDFTRLGGSERPVSFSTNPIGYDDDHLLVIVHQSTRRPQGRCYFQWGVLLDRATLMPSRITSQPLASGIGARGYMRGVLYTSSILELGSRFVLFSGEGDTCVTRIGVSRKRLDRLWYGV